MNDVADPKPTPLLCSSCFGDYGLSFDAHRLGLQSDEQCPQCGHTDGNKLDKEGILKLAYRFFVLGTTVRMEYGAAPIIQFNEHHYGRTEINVTQALRRDAELIGEAAGIGFFPYGPRLWMVGEVEPLKALQDPSERPAIVERILKEYPERIISSEDKLVRLRKNPSNPMAAQEYDSPPAGIAGAGRLDAPDFPVMYASQDIEVCVHECRATVEDDLFLATLGSTRPLRCLDVTRVLREEATEFESIDMAVHMLFLAGQHSYEICRAIAAQAQEEGFDGLVYPSYFHLVSTGTPPFETAYGISVRRFESYQDTVEALTIPNVALFGRPVATGLMGVDGINRLVLGRISYDVHFGPAAC